MYTIGIWLVYAWLTKNYQKNDRDWKCLTGILLILVYVRYTKAELVYGLVKGYFRYTIAMFNTRGYKKWLFLTGIRRLYSLVVYAYQPFFCCVVLTANPCLLKMGSCVQYWSLFKRITTHIGLLPIFDHLLVTPEPFTSSNTKALWCHSAGKKSKYTGNEYISCQIWEQPVRTGQDVQRDIWWCESSWILSEYINNSFNRIIDHIQVGTWLFVQFHNDFLNLYTLRSCEQINAVRVDFRLHRKCQSSICIFMYQILVHVIPQCQDMRTQCKLFFFNFIFRVAVKRNMWETTQNKFNQNNNNYLSFSGKFILHFQWDHSSCNQTPPPTIHPLPL